MPRFFMDHSPSDDEAYRKWLFAHPDKSGVVVNLRSSPPYVVHWSFCPSISYELDGARNPARSPKMCFESVAEARSELGSLTSCSKCDSRV